MSQNVVFENVTKTYASRRGAPANTVISNFSHEVAENEFLCLLGPSGCGKSTVLNMVAGFGKPTAGRVLVGGKPVGGPGPDRGVVFQQYALFPWYNVYRNVELGPEAKGVSSAEKREIVEHMLRAVGLWEHRHKYPKELSGGMKQRAAIARTLAAKPQVILMDEPFAALDAMSREHLQQELLSIWDGLRCTVIFVTHSVQEAVLLADRVTIFGVDGGSAVKSLASPLSRPRDRLSDEVIAFEREVHAYLRKAEAGRAPV
ncbi:ABC transporter ATP-binding protein [Devosia honganensis]|uniref:ABC transporter ATP-binding protein n=1 Tax=Devosia honganensis TaxID=1610527 RepID=A0ABV7X0B9_9HYPH